jgi:DNA-binding phage protein
MDQRLKHRTHDDDLALRDELYLALREHRIALPDAIRQMQRISRLTQPEYAKHRGVSLATLRKILAGDGNPTVDTINRLVSPFGLEVGLVPKRKKV